MKQLKSKEKKPIGILRMALAKLIMDLLTEICIYQDHLMDIMRDGQIFPDVAFYMYGMLCYNYQTFANETAGVLAATMRKAIHFKTPKLQVLKNTLCKWWLGESLQVDQLTKFASKFALVESDTKNNEMVLSNVARNGNLPYMDIGTVIHNMHGLDVMNHIYDLVKIKGLHERPSDLDINNDNADLNECIEVTDSTKRTVQLCGRIINVQNLSMCTPDGVAVKDLNEFMRLASRDPKKITANEIEAFGADAVFEVKCLINTATKNISAKGGNKLKFVHNVLQILENNNTAKYKSYDSFQPIHKIPQNVLLYHMENSKKGHIFPTRLYVGQILYDKIVDAAGKITQRNSKYKVVDVLSSNYIYVNRRHLFMEQLTEQTLHVQPYSTSNLYSTLLIILTNSQGIPAAFVAIIVNKKQMKPMITDYKKKSKKVLETIAPELVRIIKPKARDIKKQGLPKRKQQQQQKHRQRSDKIKQNTKVNTITSKKRKIGTILDDTKMMPKRKKMYKPELNFD